MHPLLPMPCHIPSRPVPASLLVLFTPFGGARCSYILLSLLWLPRVTLKAPSGSHCLFLFPLDNSPLLFSTLSPWEWQRKISPFLHSWGCTTCSEFSFPAPDTFPDMFSLGRGWVSGLYCRYLEGNIIQSSLGFGDKVLRDSISFVFWIFCQSWPLESPFFLASLPSFQSQVQVQLSLSKPAAGYLASFPLLWVRTSLKSHLTICTGTLGS